MEYQVLARKWRPKTFDDLIGQEHIVRTLTNAIQMDRIAHAYLFTGIRGVGKTSAARILAKALNCQDGPSATPKVDDPFCQEIDAGSFIDVLEIDGASNTGVDDVRELKENVQYLPSKGRYKIYIIDEVHMLSKAAFNALLKTLEEPPKGVVFIFATTEPNRLPETILSRCQRFDFKRVGRQIIASRLQHIAQQEGVEVSDAVLQEVARESQGSVRDALTLFDRLISFCGSEVDDEQARELLGLIDENMMRELLRFVVVGNTPEAIKLTHSIYTSGYSMRRLLEGLMQEFRNALLLKVGLTADEAGVPAEMATELSAIFADTHEIELERFFDITKRALFDFNRTDQEIYLVETALIKLCGSTREFVQIREVLNKLGAAPSTSTASKPAPNNTAAASSQEKADTIEDAYVKNAVGLFGAKVGKVQLSE